MPSVRATKHEGPGAQPKYPWKELKVGESFYFAPHCKSYSVSGGAYANKMGNALKREFTTHKTKKGRIKVTRVG
jgi:hypothetical protein